MRHEGGGYSAKNQKLSHWGLVSVNETQRVLNFSQWDRNSAGYAVVEGLGGGE